MNGTPGTERGTIERSIEIDATCETVFEVISSPLHLTKWWPDEAQFETAEGSSGQIVFGDRSTGEATVPNLTILEVTPPHRFRFRWLHPDDEEANADNSLLVTFDLEPRGNRTLLHMTEEGFREQGWEVVTLEEQYRLHDEGWNHHLGRLVAYAPTVNRP